MKRIAFALIVAFCAGFFMGVCYGEVISEKPFTMEELSTPDYFDEKGNAWTIINVVVDGKPEQRVIKTPFYRTLKLELKKKINW